MRYKGVVSYFGKNYIGWQSQSNKSGIEDEIEKRLSYILNEKINIYGSGRTDKGVHAYGQVFHFDTSKEIKDINHLVYALNRLLPGDIHIKSLKKTNKNFHSRFSAKKKVYIYKIYQGKDEIPFYINTHMIVHKPLDIDRLLIASKVFIGKHNFQNLTSKEIDDKGFIREIYDIKIKTNIKEIVITFIGNAFMRYMVRYIVGEMVAFSESKKEINDLKLLFANNRKITNLKAPAEGLYLYKVIY